MKCSEFQTNLPDLLDGSAPDELARELQRHVAECSACAAAYQADLDVLDAVTPRLHVHPSPELRDRILRAAVQPAPTRNPRPFRIAIGVFSAAAVLFLGIVFSLRTPVRAARSCFRDAVVALSDVSSLHMELRIRTKPAENFSYTSPREDFVPHTLTVAYDGPTPRWRVEKSGRKALYDGNRIYMWSPAVSEGTIHLPGADAIEELSLLLDPRLLLVSEEEYTRTHSGATYTIDQQADTIRLTVVAPAAGDYSQSDYMLNTSISESNTQRQYAFDRRSGRLLSARIDILTDAGTSTILVTDRIAYDLPVDTARLAARPDGIQWIDLTRPVGGSRLAGITASEATRRILEALSAWDGPVLDEALCYYGDRSREQLRLTYRGIVPVKVGEPEHSGSYAGLFVPCSILYPDGRRGKIMLALRNDNPSHSWIVDGGL